MSEEEIKRYLASIGKMGGEAGRGASKIRGGKGYYERISKLAAKARKAQKAAKNKERKTT
jgi:hypothetical protein